LASLADAFSRQSENLPDYHDIPDESAYPSAAIQLHIPTPYGSKSPPWEEAMREQAAEAGRDRLSTPHELDEVIDPLIVRDQLSMSVLAFLESEDSRIEEKELELWPEAVRDRLREAVEIERLTNIILGRSQKLN
jgi:hypothetical protein